MAAWMTKAPLHMSYRGVAECIYGQRDAEEQSMGGGTIGN